MSNVIQIKRGYGMPDPGILMPYELGYAVVYNNEGNIEEDGGYLYIGENKNGEIVTQGIKVEYAKEAGIANGLSQEAENLIKEIKVNSALGSDQALGLGQDYTISAERNTLTWFQTHSSYAAVGATTENCIPTGYWWNIIRFNHWNASSLHYTDLAIPMDDIYTGLSYKQVIKGSVRDNSWINILDSYNYSNYALPITGGTIQLDYATTDEIKPGITLATHWADTSSVNYGSSIKFMMFYPNEALRYSSIEGYANSQYANTTGLRFKVYDISKGYDEATFVGGVFTTPKLNVTEQFNMTQAVLNAIYPVGSIYMSINSTSPQTLFGGTWEQLKDRFLVGAGDTFNEPGGSTVHTHALSDNAYAKINHHGGNFYFEEVEVDAYQTSGRGSSSGEFYDSFSETSAIPLGGATNSASNLPPYLPVYMWKRTA